MGIKWRRNLGVVLAAGTVVGIAGVIGYPTQMRQGPSSIPTVKSANVSNLPSTTGRPKPTTQTLTPGAPTR
jgi:hypothetical protein